MPSAPVGYHHFSAVFLLTTGCLGATMNLLGMSSLWSYVCREGSDQHPGSAYIFALLSCDLFVCFMTVPATVSSLYHRWLWGETTCHFYAALDSFSCAFQMALVSLISYERYVCTFKSHELTRQRDKSIYHLTIFLFGVIIFVWASCPLVGWSSYSLTPAETMCSLNWTRRDTLYTTYLTVSFVTIYLVPFCAASSLYYSIYQRWKERDNAEADTSGIADTIVWAPQRHVGKVSVGCVASTFITYIGYGYVCLQPYGHDFDEYSFREVLPPLLTRLSVVFNPVFHIFCNPELLTSLRRVVHNFCTGCQQASHRRRPSMSVSTSLLQYAPKSINKSLSNNPKQSVKVRQQRVQIHERQRATTKRDRRGSLPVAAHMSERVRVKRLPPRRQQTIGGLGDGLEDCLESQVSLDFDDHASPV